MKREYLSFIAIYIIALLALFDARATAQEFKSVPNPAAAYCIQMGYQYEIRKDKAGNEDGVCVFPDKTEANAWDFFKGKSGRKFSYCAKKGYETNTKKIIQEGYTQECAECILKSKKGVIQERVDMLELMNRNQEPLRLNSRPESNQIQPNKTAASSEKKNSQNETIPSAELTQSLPPSFDWRNYNGHCFIGPVRDQGDCGSCYAFGATAAAEGAYNFANNLYDGNCVDFSESFMWCLAALLEYAAHFSGCDGADYEYAELQALVDFGITEETAYPYTIIGSPCCDHLSDTSVKFSQWHRVACGDVEGIKTAIMTYGVIDAAVYVSSGFENYSGGIFKDNQTSCPDCEYTTTNHGIALVGWGNDATYGDYWILRNSWGNSWGENGYMRIAATSARVACEAAYLIYGSPASPAADFISLNCNNISSSIICAGSTMTLRDKSSGIPDSWQWTISPSAGVAYVNQTSGASQHPAVQFLSPGAYSVSLTASNGSGSNTLTRTNYIRVICGQTIRLNLTTDSFGDETTWTLTDIEETLFYSGGPFAAKQNYIQDMCLNPGSYVFTIFDSYGDGICCRSGKGYYSLFNLTTGAHYVTSNGKFSYEQETPFTLSVARGDMDWSGFLELKDAVLSLQVSAGLPLSSTVYIESDADGDGKLGIDEAIYILEKVAGVRE